MVALSSEGIKDGLGELVLIRAGCFKARPPHMLPCCDTAGRGSLEAEHVGPPDPGSSNSKEVISKIDLLLFTK